MAKKKPTRLYCSKCDSLRPKELFWGDKKICKDCSKGYTRNYIQKNHDEAVKALGEACIHPSCDRTYRPPTTLLYMVRTPDCPIDVYPKSQYARDKAIIQHPEHAKKYILLLCKDHRPMFVSSKHHPFPETYSTNQE